MKQKDRRSGLLAESWTALRQSYEVRTGAARTLARAQERIARARALNAANTPDQEAQQAPNQAQQ
jgi:hypothetical protein